MRLPAALVPLRNSTFRILWLANVVAWLGTWLQNTGAGWLMTSLAPQPLIVAMVQAATIMPVFLLALPGGALADIVDRRVFLIGTQFWTILAAIALAALTIGHAMTAFWLLALTFAIGIGVRADRARLERDRAGTGAARGPGAGDRAERHRLQPDPRDRARRSPAS